LLYQLHQIRSPVKLHPSLQAEATTTCVAQVYAQLGEKESSLTKKSHTKRGSSNAHHANIYFSGYAVTVTSGCRRRDFVGLLALAGLFRTMRSKHFTMRSA
jgi:hypothetical protein